MTRGLALLLLLSTGACAYYNGLYNARGLVRRAESAARDGRDSAAVAAWREAAAKADTVVARYPRSRWTDDALLLSGVASSLAGACEHGLQRLGEWQAHPAAAPKRRAWASIARGACLVRFGDHARALDTLEPLTTSRDDTQSRIAAAWAARAALAIGEADRATAFARRAASDALDAELAMTAIGLGRAAVAAQVLRQRATAWRSLAPLHQPLGILARSHRPVTDSIVRLAQQSRAGRPDRARLSLAAGTWAEAAGDDAAARDHYERALRTSSDTALVSEVVARAGLLAVRTAATLEEARARLDHAKAKSLDATRLAGVDSALQLTTRLAETSDASGASLFLAAETARDAVGALPLARGLFLRIAREYAASSLAPRALLAAANLTPDSAGAWNATVLERYGNSPYAQVLAGAPVSATAFDADEKLLRQAWTRARAAADSSRLATDRRRP